MADAEWEIFVVDEVRGLDSILLVTGDKAGHWGTWYQEAIPWAEERYGMYLKERAAQEGDQQ